MKQALGILFALLLAAGCTMRPTRIRSIPDLPPEPKTTVKTGPPLWAEQTGPPADGHYFASATGDLNGDGRFDLVAGSFEPGGIAIWLARPDETWEFSFVLLPSSEVRDILMVDLNGDGRDEIVAVSRGGIDGILLLRSPDSGPWGRPEPISKGSGYEAITAGDLNRDGFPDLVAARGKEGVGGGLEILLGDGQLGFVQSSGASSAGAFRDAALGDLDGDGILDLAACGWGIEGAVYLFRGTGTGAFDVPTVLGAGRSYRGVALADVTGDGTLDVLAATYRDGIYLFPGGDPNAAECPVIQEGSFWSLLALDADHNGRNEVYASSSNGQGVVGWEFSGKCDFNRVSSGLPRRDIWYGLHYGRLGNSRASYLIGAGFEGSLRYFTATGESDSLNSIDRVRTRVNEVEERWSRGNDTFTMSQGFAEYRLGVRDRLRIRVLAGDTVQEVETRVQSDGEVFVPVQGIGSVPARGASPTQVKKRILEKAAKIWRDPHVEVVVLDYESHTISLLGEVRSTSRSDSGPGRYPIKGKTRVVDFLSQHGGPTERADLNRVQIIRPSGRSNYLNLYKAILSSDIGENPILNQGDTIFVPSITLSNRKVFVLGEVKKPGLLELKDDVTLLEAIARMEGFTEKAFLQNVLVVRGGLTAPELISVNLLELLEEGNLAHDLPLRNGDIVYLPRRRVYDVKDVFSSIQPALDMIESLFIIDNLTTR